jgi:Rrf2 family protein
MISLTAEYALRAIVWMARRADRAVGTREIAEATHVPVGYLSKVLQALARRGLVQSWPGRAGGFLLSRKPAAISVLDIVQAVDPIQRVERCPLGLRQHRGGLCPLHRRLDQAAALVEQAFAACSIAELVHEAEEHDVLCSPDAPPKAPRREQAISGQGRRKSRPAGQRTPEPGRQDRCA